MILRSIQLAVIAMLLSCFIAGCNDQDKNTTQITSAESTMNQEDNANSYQTGKMPPLTEQEKYVIEQAGTERAFTGKYWDHFEKGHYICRKCGQPLYKSSSKFESHCGWPSFDDEIEGAVTRRIDSDGRRTEILCSNCGGHLGHVFLGEGFTDKNTRHCVNSISMQFVPEKTPETEKAYLAGGCFWGIEHFLEKLDGIINVNVGYCGGYTENPSYRKVVNGDTGHAESAEIEFNPQILSYEELIKYFFEIHDPTQYMRQGNDVGSQYRSAIFHVNESQKQTAQKIINTLKKAGYDIKTELKPFEKFYLAEEYHQDYLQKNPNGYCAHEYTPRFDKIELNQDE